MPIPKVGDRVRDRHSGVTGIVVQTIRKYPPYIMYVFITDSGRPMVGKGWNAEAQSLYDLLSSSYTSDMNVSFDRYVSVEELLTHPSEEVQKIGLRRKKS